MEPALWFYDEIKRLGINLTTVADAYVESAAIPVFLAGKTRIITPRTTIQFHNCICEIEAGSFTPEKLIELAQVGTDAAKKLQNTVATLSGNKLNALVVANFMQKNTRIDHNMAVQYGLAHKIESL